MLVLLAIGTAFMIYKGKDVEVSYKFSRLLPITDSVQIEYNKFNEDFKQVGNTIVIAAENLEVFDRDNYNTWLQLERDLKAIEGVQNVVSPISSYDLRRNDSLQELEILSFESLREELTIEEQSDLFYNLPFYKGILYSKDLTTPLMLVQIEGDDLYVKRIVEIIEEIRVINAAFEEKTKVELHTSGLPWIRMANTKKVSKEIFLFIALSLSITSLLLYFFLRSFKATIISLLVVIIAVCWTFGLISGLGFKITMLSSLVPSLIIVIGVPNCIFLINKYHNEYKEHKNQILSVQRVIRRIGAATLLTNTTTALGFAALILTDSIILREFGIVASINILMVFVISIIIIPISYSFSKVPKPRHYSHLEKNWVSLFLNFLINTVENRRTTVYIIFFILTGFGIVGTTKILTTGNLSEEFPKNGTLYKDLKFLENKFGGVVPLEIIIDTKKPKGVQKTGNLKKINKLQERLSEIPELSKSVSIVDGVKFAKQAYFQGDSSFYRLPTRQERSFIADYLPDSESNISLLSSLTDSTGQVARVSVKIEDLGTEDSKIVMSQIKRITDNVFSPDKYDVTITGASVVFLKGTDYLIKNLMISLLLAILVISIIMALLFRSMAMVVVSLIPNLFPLLVTAGIMGFFGIPLKPSTILVFSIAFGISVDDTIHFLAKYRQELRHSNWNIYDSVIASIHETGISMFYTSIVLFFGFSVFMASSFGGTVSLGILVSLTLIIAMLSNLILLPGLLLSLEKLVANKIFNNPIIRIYRDEEEEEEEDKKEEEEELIRLDKNHKA